MAQIVESPAVRIGFALRDLGGHSPNCGALTAATERSWHLATLKRLGRHKSFATLGEHLEFGDLFEGPPLSGVL